MDDDAIAALLARLPRRGADRGWGCLSDTEVAAYADGGLEGRAKQRAEDHLADCGHCLEQIGVLLRLHEAGAPEPVPRRLEEQAVALGRPKVFLRPAHRWGAVAAAAAAAAVVLMLRTPPPEVPVPAGPSAPTVVPTSQAPAPAPAPAAPETVRSRPVGPVLPEPISPRPDAVVPRARLEFRWRAVPRSLFYDVRLATAEGNLVWEAKASATSLRPPADLQIEEGRKYFVWVSAHLPEGKTVKSRALGFSVKDGS